MIPCIMRNAKNKPRHAAKTKQKPLNKSRRSGTKISIFKSQTYWRQNIKSNTNKTLRVECQIVLSGSLFNVGK